MNQSRLSLTDISHFLAETFAIDRFPTDERGGTFRSSDRPIGRLGIALEPTPGLGNWVRQHQIDALWLHRPWQVKLGTLPPDVGILYHHLPFDEVLTTGYNTRLADALDLHVVDELGYKPVPSLTPDSWGRGQTQTDYTRPLGMIGHVPDAMTADVPDLSYRAWQERIRAIFGGYDRAEPAQDESGQVRICRRVAVVGAMNPTLVREAHERGVDLYLTGEYRKGTQATVDETGIAVIAIGHRRTEEWGLQALGTLLGKQWPELAVRVTGRTHEG